MADIHAEAYGANVTLEGRTLLVEASGLPGSGALGAARGSIALDEITALHLDTASALRNGTLSVVTPDGKTQIHFRKQHTDGIRAIYDALTAAPGAVTCDAAKPLVKSAALAKCEGRTAEQADAEAVALRVQHAQAAAESERARAELIEAVCTFVGYWPLEAQQYGLVLARGERLFGVIEPAQLIEVKHARRPHPIRRLRCALPARQGRVDRCRRLTQHLRPGTRVAHLHRCGPRSDHQDARLVHRSPPNPRVVVRQAQRSRPCSRRQLDGVERKQPSDHVWARLPGRLCR